MNPLSSDIQAAFPTLPGRLAERPWWRKNTNHWVRSDGAIAHGCHP